MSSSNSNVDPIAAAAGAAIMVLVLLIAVAAALLPIFYPIATVVLIIEGVFTFLLTAGIIELFWKSPEPDTVQNVSICVAGLVCLVSAYYVVTGIEYRISTVRLYKGARLLWRVAAAGLATGVVLATNQSNWGLTDAALVIVPLLTAILTFTASTVKHLSLEREWKENG